MSPLAIVILTVVAAFGYVLLVALLFKFFFWLTSKLRGGTGIEKLVVLIPFIVVGVVCLILDIFHTVLLICLGVRMASSFRNWWHKV